MAISTLISKKVLVFGATGVIGQHIIQQLYDAQSSFPKIGIFTSSTSARTKSQELNDWKAKDVEVIIGDINSEKDIMEAYEGKRLCQAFTAGGDNSSLGYDTVISALGRNAILLQIALLKLAVFVIRSYILPFRIQYRYRIRTLIGEREAAPTQAPSKEIYTREHQKAANHLLGHGTLF